MKLGSAFSDNLIIEKKKINRLDKMNYQAWWYGSGRTLIFASLLIVSFFILIARLFDLTILKGHHYRVLADENRVRELIRHAPRGIIHDRTGKPLVANEPSFRLIRPCTDAKSICTERLSNDRGNELLKQGLPSGEFLEVDYRRNYLAGETVAHVTGYTAELTAEELTDEYYSLRKYKPGDKIGRDGVEAVFEDRLRGRDGKELIEVDAQGNMIRTLGIDPEVAGNSITLSIDAGLSEAVAKAFPVDIKGVVVVSKPQTGEILALYSSPSYNPNLFTAGLTDETFKVLFRNADLPLFNRAIGGVYPPGSTFKIVTALSALSEGAIKLDTTFEDVGVLRIGPNFSFPNWYFLQYGKTEGTIGLVRAIARSNDIYFYKTGEQLGITKLVEWAKKFGIGRPLGVELAGEASGLMPGPEWKNERFSTAADREAGNNNWYVGDTYHVSIGQGYLLVTPLHVNSWTSAVANEGKRCQPTIEKVINMEKRKASCKDIGIREEYLKIVTEGMIEACNTGGTGWPLFNFSVPQPGFENELDASPSARQHSRAVPIACKTGTAEYGDPEGKTHAWFTAFAPLPEDYIKNSVSQETLAGEPEIAVTVLLEGAGEGSEKAAPVAKRIFEYWFTR